VYECVVVGGMKDDSGVVDAPIGRDIKNRKRNAVTDKHSRPAVTHYEVIERFQGYTHLRCRLETGRTHQIRVHLGFIGHPILGDTLYGRKKPVGGLEGQCLHARELTFVHPRTGGRMTVTTPLPDYFVAVLKSMTY
jgi:23S rRNA pseudouridine1911/1915/1917 synthase